MRIFYIVFILMLTSSLSSKSQTRIAAITEPEVKIMFYPNPAISQITFSFEKGYDKTHSLQIFNFLGKKVYETNSLQPKTTVDLAEFFRGVYIFQLRNQSGKIIESGKFQVSK